MECAEKMECLDKEGLLYTVALLRDFIGLAVDKHIREGVIDTQLKDKEVINAIQSIINEELEKLKSKLDEENIVTEDILKAQVKTSVDAAVTEAIAREKINEKISSAIAEKIISSDILSVVLADAKYVNKSGDTMTGALKAQRFVTANGIEFF